MTIYFLFMIVVGLFFKKRIKRFDDFILGGRGLPWFIITMTLLATLANAQQVLGIAGFSYKTGLSFMIWFFIITCVLIYPTIKRLGTRYRGMNFSTVADLAEERYPGSARMTILMSIFQVTWAVFSVGICLFGGALLIEVVFKVPWLVGIAISGTVTVLYCMMGGLNAVVFNEVTQWFIIVLGTAFFIPILFIKYGSFTVFFSSLLGPAGMTSNPGVGLWEGFTDLFTLAPGGIVTVKGILAMGIAGSLWIPVDLGFMQWMLAAKSVAQARKASLVFVIVIAIWATLMVAVGLYGRVLFPDVSLTDTVVILVAKEAIPFVGAALFITAITAAVMSTVSAYLNAGSAILVKNIYGRFISRGKDDAHYLRAARVCIVVIALAAMSFAPMVKSGGVFVTALTIQMVICSSLAPMVILSTYWKRMTEKAAFWGTLISAVVTTFVAIKCGGGEAAFAGAGLWGIPTVFLGLIVSIVLYLVISGLEGYDPEKVGPQFRALFEGKHDEYKVANTDLYVVAGIAAVVLGALLVRSLLKGPLSAFPPLSGSFAWLTNGYFLVAALGVTIFGLVILVYSIGWIRSVAAPIEEKDDRF